MPERTEAIAYMDLGLSAGRKKAVGFLCEFTKRLVALALSENRTITSAIKMIKEIYQIVDEIYSGCLEQSGKQPPCRKTCYWCCLLRIKATPPEVMAIANYLLTHLEQEELGALRQRLEKIYRITHSMEGHQRIGARIPCPLLVDRSCIAYTVRPIACRVYHSLNRSDCEISIDVIDHKISIQRDIADLSMGVLAGLAEGLRALGLRSNQLELVSGLLLAFDESSAVLEKHWFSCEPSYAEAEISTAHDVEMFHRSIVDYLSDS